MATSSSSHMSPSKLATYNRQKCINLLEKITKNMFRMFRDEETDKEQIIDRFFVLKDQLDGLGDIVLNSEYHQEMKVYIEHLSSTFGSNFTLDGIRSVQMSKLNRIQKIKNTNGYKREKKTKRNKEHRHSYLKDE